MVNEGYFAPILSNNANGKIISIDWSDAEKLEGVIGPVSYVDVQGQNEIGDEEFFRSKTTTSCGQIIGGIVAFNEKIARRAAKLVKVNYEDNGRVIVTLEDAIKYESYLPNAPRLRHDRGSPDESYESREGQRILNKKNPKIYFIFLKILYNFSLYLYSTKRIILSINFDRLNYEISNVMLTTRTNIVFFFRETCFKA